MSAHHAVRAHERAVPGPAADFAAGLAARLPRIETARLVLRAPRLADFDLWREILGGPAAPWLGGPFSRGESFAEFATAVGLWLLRGHGLWSVDDRAGTHVGFILLGFEPGDHEPELGFLFAPFAEGMGYATEAARAAREHAFVSMGLPSLVSYIAPENHRSAAVATRLGARRDARAEAAFDEPIEVWRHLPPATGARNE